MTDVVLMALFVGGLLYGKMPSITLLLGAALTFRNLPRPFDEAITGLILIIGGAAAKRRMARDRDYQ